MVSGLWLDVQVAKNQVFKNMFVQGKVWFVASQIKIDNQCKIVRNWNKE
jgi:hypothetical protein